MLTLKRILAAILPLVVPNLATAQTIPMQRVTGLPGALAAKADGTATTTALAAKVSKAGDTVTGVVNLPTPALSIASSSTQAANVAFLPSALGKMDLRFYANYSAADVTPALNSCIADQNAATISRCSWPEGNVILNTAVNSVHCSDCGWDFNNTLIIRQSSSSAGGNLFQLGDDTASATRFSTTGTYRVNYQNTPAAGTYIWYLYRTALVTLPNFSVNNTAGIAKLGSASFGAVQTSFRNIRGLAQQGADTDWFLFQNGANVTVEDFNVTANITCNTSDTGFFVFRPLAGKPWDTSRIGPNVGAQCFTVGVDEEGNSTGPADGKRYGIILDSTLGASALYNNWVGPNDFIDHTTVCNVLIKTAPGDVAILRNNFFRGSRLTTDNGQSLCAYNDGNLLIRSFVYENNRTSIPGAGPHVTIRGANWRGASLTNNNFADSVPATAKPKSISVASDGWTIANNNWASAQSTTGVVTAISIDDPGITVASIHDNYAPDVTTLIAEPTYTIPDASAPKRQIGTFLAKGTTAQYLRGDKTWQTFDKAAVGLGSVDNTADAVKPVSIAQAAADALKLNIAGGTLTGALALAADPASALQAATKQYVDAADALKANLVSGDARIRLASDFTTPNTTITTVTGFGATIKANTVYQIYGTIIVQSAAITNGAGVGITLPGTPIFDDTTIREPITQSGAGSPTFVHRRANSGIGANASVDTANADMLFIIEGTFSTDTPGTMNIRVIAEGDPAATNVIVKAGSSYILREIP